MPAIAWNDANDRALLLQLLALHPISVTSAEWNLISQTWDCGTKGDSFRKHFDKLKGQYVSQIVAGDGKKIVKSKEDVANGKRGLTNKEHYLMLGAKRNSSAEEPYGKAVKKARAKAEVVEDNSMDGVTNRTKKADIKEEEL